jgi:uncharacterized protein YndB with AHSA1/START domain
MTEDDRTITITRLFDAPQSLVFASWLTPEHLVQWYNAGDGWTTPYAQTDPRTGGRFKIGFAGPDGKIAFDFTGSYNEVSAPDRLVFTIDDGRPVTVDFATEGSKTRIILTLTLENTHSEEQQRQGWSAMLANLDTHLESVRT